MVSAKHCPIDHRFGLHRMSSCSRGGRQPNHSDIYIPFGICSGQGRPPESRIQIQNSYSYHVRGRGQEYIVWYWHLESKIKLNTSLNIWVHIHINIIFWNLSGFGINKIKLLLTKDYIQVIQVFIISPQDKARFSAISMCIGFHFTTVFSDFSVCFLPLPFSFSTSFSWVSGDASVSLFDFVMRLSSSFATSSQEWGRRKSSCKLAEELTISHGRWGWTHGGKL